MFAMSLALWLAFLVASILISVSPGPGAASAMSTGLSHGYRATVAVIAGLQVALLLQLAVVFAGLGALLATSETAFAILRFAGAAYLVWLGIAKWRAAARPVTATVADGRGLFVQGLLVNLSNPKAIVFSAALVPQFIDPTGSQLLQFGIIAATMCAVDIVVMSGYALLATSLKPWLASPRLLAMQNRVFGAVFVVAGGALALAARRA